METEDFILLDSKKILAVVYFDIEKQMLSLRPFFCDFFPQAMYIESTKDLTKFQMGQVIEADVIEMCTDVGGVYLYCNENN